MSDGMYASQYWHLRSPKSGWHRDLKRHCESFCAPITLIQSRVPDATPARCNIIRTNDMLERHMRFGKVYSVCPVSTEDGVSSTFDYQNSRIRVFEALL